MLIDFQEIDFVKKKKLEAEEKLRLQEIDWMNNWRKAGLVGDLRKMHPNSGN